MEQQFLTDSAIEWRLLFEISEEEDKASRGMSKYLKNVFCITVLFYSIVLPKFQLQNIRLTNLETQGCRCCATSIDVKSLPVDCTAGRMESNLSSQV